jgi:hypothetical protein
MSSAGWLSFVEEYLSVQRGLGVALETHRLHVAGLYSLRGRGRASGRPPALTDTTGLAVLVSISYLCM